MSRTRGRCAGIDANVGAIIDETGNSSGFDDSGRTRWRVSGRAQTRIKYTEVPLKIRRGSLKAEARDDR